MRYPLYDTDQYLGTITFIPIQESYLDLTRAASDTINDIATVPQFSESVVGVDDIRSKRTNSSRTVSTPRVTYNGAEGPVTLYLPQAITVSDQVSYERIDLGAVGAVGAAAIAGGASPTQALKTAGLEAGKTVTDLLLNRSNMASEIAGLAALRLLPSGTAQNVAKTALGVAVNPNTKSLFRSVELRTFGFTFKMIATSAAEANAIEQIVKMFRTELYPETINTSSGFFNAPIGYKFPNKFRIKLEYNGKQIPIKFLDSNLLNVQTVYNPSSMGWHADGKPSEVDLTLSFGEPRTLSKQDVRDKGY